MATNLKVVGIVVAPVVGEIRQGQDTSKEKNGFIK